MKIIKLGLSLFLFIILVGCGQTDQSNQNNNEKLVFNIMVDIRITQVSTKSINIRPKLQ